MAGQMPQCLPTAMLLLLVAGMRAVSTMIKQTVAAVCSSVGLSRDEHFFALNLSLLLAVSRSHQSPVTMGAHVQYELYILVVLCQVPQRLRKLKTSKQQPFTACGRVSQA